MKIRVGRNLMLGSVMTFILAGIGVAVLAAGGIVAWEYSNSNAFCTNMCHAVHPEEPKAHAASFHARVNCVECHMGRLSTLQLMAIKPTHINELWGMIVGYERPVHTHSLRPARESCEACHWPEARHNDTMRVKYRYADDAKSTETRTTLQLHTGTGAGLGERIHRDGAAGQSGRRHREGHPLAHRAGRRIRRARPRQAEDPADRGARQDREGDGDIFRSDRRDQSRRRRQDAEAADRLHRLPQCVGASVQQSREPRRQRARGGPHRPQPAVDQGALRRHHQERRRDLGARSGALGEVRGADRRRGAKRRRGGEDEGRGAEVRRGNEAHPAADVVRDQGSHVEDVPERRRPQGLPRVLPLSRRQAHERQGPGDTPAVHALPCAAERRLGKRCTLRCLDRESRPDPAGEATKSRTGCTIIARTWTAAARCATARSSGARTAAASAPIRRAMGASGRR